MSKIAPYIKQAFGTSNAHEAASFLATACNRMKGMDKAAIAREVEAALNGVNFTRGGSTAGSAQPKTKTVYKDTPETVKRLAEFERRLLEIRAELEKVRAENNSGAPFEITRLQNRIADLKRYIDGQKTQHLEELALLRSTQQATFSETSAERDALSSELKEANAKIDRLKMILAEVASGNDADTAARKEAERELAAEREEADILRGMIKRDAAALENSRNRFEHEAGEHRETKQDNERLAARLAAVDRELEELRDGKISEKRRGDAAYAILEQQKRATAEANHTCTQLRARLKIEEYNGQKLTGDVKALQLQIQTLETKANKDEEDARHNYYQCESLSNALHMRDLEIAALRKQTAFIFGFLKRKAFYTAVVLGACAAGFALLNGQVELADACKNGAIAAGIAYVIAHNIFTS